VNVDAVKRIFTEPGKSQFWPYVKKRIAFQWGGLSDPFDPIEKKLGIGLKLLKFFREIEYPICFSTKATWWLEDERYVSLFKGADFFNVKFSIITGDHSKAKFIEKGVPSPAERLKAIEKYSKLNNGGATLRLRPFIIGVSNPSHIQLIKDAASAGATAMTTEFFCMETRSKLGKQNYEKMSQVTGFDLTEFYRKYSRGAGYLRLNRNAKREFVDQMEAAAKEAGIRFYVSDAHFKERCNNGSCCGLPDSWNYSKGQFCEALVIAREKGQVVWDDIEADMEYAKTFLWRKAQGYNVNTSEKRAKFYSYTMYDYLKWCWNNPKQGASPYKMFEGVLKPIKKDEKGNLVYIIDRGRT
jgi:DNA repair photolyase